MTSLSLNHRTLKHVINRKIDIYSPSGKENNILEYLKGYFKRRGVKNVVSQDVDENRYNLIILKELWSTA